MTYTWDALQRRVSRTDATRTTIYVQNGQQTVADYVQGQSATAGKGYRYIYGDYVDEPRSRLNTANNTRLYYHRNQQYSIIAITNSDGSVIERYAYNAYGEVTRLRGNGTAPTTNDANRYTYTGREWDAGLELYHYRARMYDPAAGRFCSRDPIGYADGYNAYSYVRDCPLNLIDPEGLSWWWPPSWPIFNPPPTPMPPTAMPAPPPPKNPSSAVKAMQYWNQTLKKMGCKRFACKGLEKIWSNPKAPKNLRDEALAAWTFGGCAGIAY